MITPDLYFIEIFVVFIAFIVFDIALSIKRVPIIGFLLGIIQFFTTTVLFLNSDLDITLTVVSALFTCIMIITNALEMKK